MRNGRTAFFALLIALSLCVAASAAVGDVSYGPWSEWSDQPIENKTNLFVETQEVERPVTRRAWRYTRYTVRDESGTRRVAQASEAPGAPVEVIELASPLGAVGERGGVKVYEGEWFNQEAVTVTDHLEAVTQYRAREIFLETCALEPASLILEPGGSAQLGVATLSSEAYSLTSDHPEIASVDQDGIVSAGAPGRARISLIYAGQTAVCEVMVHSGKTELKKGLYALRLSGARLAAGYKVGKTEVTDLALSPEPEGAKPAADRRFLVDRIDGDSFSLRALCPLIAYVAAPLTDEGAPAAGAAEVKMIRDLYSREKEIERIKAEQAAADGLMMPDPDGGSDRLPDGGGPSCRFQAVETGEGDVILRLAADPSLALTAASAAEGSGLAIEKLSLADPRQRWALEPEKGDVAADKIWRLPVADNSFNEITDDFKTMARDGDKHEGVDFAPTGNRDAVAVAGGRVVKVDDRCTHDFRKTKTNKYGRYIDPCDEEDGVISKYGSYGKYVIIEHADGTRSMYGHLSKILVRSGQKVEKGEVIGKMGSTGSANGTHLHFEVRVGGRAVDPRYFLDLSEIGQYVP